MDGNERKTEKVIQFRREDERRKEDFKCNFVVLDGKVVVDRRTAPETLGPDAKGGALERIRIRRETYVNSITSVARTALFCSLSSSTITKINRPSWTDEQGEGHE